MLNLFFKDIEIQVLINIYKPIDTGIVEDAPFSVREGGMIKRGYSSELDEIYHIMNSGKDFLLEIEGREREATGIKNMKIKYNKVFGYFIEITKSNLDMVPETYIRKQTLSNAERFVTPELKKYEDTIINSKAKIEDMEYYLFKEISGKIKEHKSLLVRLAEKLAYLDVMISFATAAIENGYVRPEINNEFDMKIIEGRHPVVEKLIGRGDFVSNDTLLSEAKLSVVDKYLTRIGASDDILSGQSTFMVEMSEVSNIINNATENSLIILDEVGRGTSTFDGVSIATAISEYLHEKIRAKTIFATHYHELTDLENKFENIVNYRIEVKEKNGKVMFLRNIIKGGADRSYGIEVAKLAGLPKEILKESREILHRLEQRKELIEKTINVKQLSLFGQIAEIDSKYEEKNIDVVENERDEKIDEVIFDIENKDINNITPMEALKFLSEIKAKLEEKN